MVHLTFMPFITVQPLCDKHYSAFLFEQTLNSGYLLDAFLIVLTSEMVCTSCWIMNRKNCEKSQARVRLAKHFTLTPIFAFSIDGLSIQISNTLAISRSKPGDPGLTNKALHPTDIDVKLRVLFPLALSIDSMVGI